MNVPVTGSQPGNTGYMLASFRELCNSTPRGNSLIAPDNTINSIIPIRPGILVTLADNTTSLKAGAANLLVLNTGDPKVALDGALLHARTAAGVPVGHYSDAGGIFVPFPGCGRTKGGAFNGVVHSMIITCNVSPSPKHLVKSHWEWTEKLTSLWLQATYTMLSYHAPKCGTEPITLGGLSVTDNGFGVWNFTFPVVGGVAPDQNGDCDGTTKTSESITEIFEELEIITK
jgi:hypothetical protein